MKLLQSLAALFSGRPAEEILTLDPEPIFAAIGLREHLTQQRANGVASMLERIRGDARAALAAG